MNSLRPLEKNLRNKLEKVIEEARDTAESAARIALEQLGVGEATAFAYLSENQKELRRKLRIHSRQLGDIRNDNGEQEINRIIEEVAYEYWHRMLFARFLAENKLLMYWSKDSAQPIDIDIETCQGLIDEGEETATSKWDLAAHCATRMLPQIFRPDSPLFQLLLPPEAQKKLERLLAELPEEVFMASDSLGWVYQFWQAKKKEEVNKSEVKIGARELPAVTQLFTEPYMVNFLLDNSLGAWWATRQLTEADRKNAKSEGELRKKASIPGVPLEYLRFTSHSPFMERGPGGEVWIPAAGTFDTWPKHLNELKILDPCCGSGHFLVAAFLMLVPMRMQMENLSAQEAVNRVLAENIHGLELDQRCVELAAFALALTAWRYPNGGGYRKLPELNLACSGLSVSVTQEEWKSLTTSKQADSAMDRIYEEFNEAPLLGSLLNPSKNRYVNWTGWSKVESPLREALSKVKTEEQYEMGVVAHGLAKTAQLLEKKYQLVLTNVPYLASGKQDEKLKKFCEKNYPSAKSDLATVFLDRCLEFCTDGGTVSLVLPQNWLFLGSYEKFREKLLKNETWHLIARLGPKSFQTPMWDFNVQLIILSRGSSDEFLGKKGRNFIQGLDVSTSRTANEKAEALLTAEIKSVEQSKQLENPDARIAFDEVQGELLEKYALAYIGQRTGDGLRFICYYWEFGKIPKSWNLFGTTVNDISKYSGNTQLILWEDGKGSLAKYQAELAQTQYASGGWKQGWQAWDKFGIRVSQMRILPVTIHCGPHFDNNTAVIIPYNPEHLVAIWCFCSSPEYSEAVRRIDQKLNVTNATLVKVPFDLDRWTQVAKEKYPNGLPEPYSDDPTQWIFHGHPCGSVIWDEKQKWTANGPLRTDATVLQVAVLRLLGYRWPAELDNEMDLSDEARAWVQKSEELLPYADKEGIVCIPSMRATDSATDRIFKILVASYGNKWSKDTLTKLLKQADHEDKSLESWLREKFFTQHCKLFQQRPFIWHIWDGLRDGFAVLVNYHKLDTKLLESLIYTYLGDWISAQKKDIASKIDGAQEKLAAAEQLKKSLELILKGEDPYDIFVRWKPIEKQPIGWVPDLNDGVRLNIRPFLSVPDVGNKGAGVLRDKPSINWGKDRGKDVESAPWYPLFKGDRINDHHLSLAEKKATQKKNNHEDKR